MKAYRKASQRSQGTRRRLNETAFPWAHVPHWNPGYKKECLGTGQTLVSSGLRSLSLGPVLTVTTIGNGFFGTVVSHNIPLYRNSGDTAILPLCGHPMMLSIHWFPISFLCHSVFRNFTWKNSKTNVEQSPLSHISTAFYFFKASIIATKTWWKRWKSATFPNCSYITWWWIAKGSDELPQKKPLSASVADTSLKRVLVLRIQVRYLSKFNRGSLLSR